MEYGLGKVEESVELWFSDNQTDHVKVSVKVEKQLFGEQTDFQRIDVFESREFGRFLSSDGSIVFSEKDEFIYDEMIVPVSYTHLRAHETGRNLVCRLLLEKKKKEKNLYI